MVAVEVLVLFPYANEQCAGAAHLVKLRGKALVTAVPRCGEELTVTGGTTVVVQRAIRRQHLGDLYLEVSDIAPADRDKETAREAAAAFRRSVHGAPFRLEPSVVYGHH